MPNENGRTAYAVWDGDIIRYHDDFYREVARFQTERVVMDEFQRMPVNIFIDEQPVTFNFTIESENIAEEAEFENSEELDRFLDEFALKEVC